MADIAKAICSLAAKFAGSSVTETSDIADAVTLVKDSYTAPEGLPAVTAADNGKVLGVSSGEWEAVAAPEELPAVTAADNGKVLGVSGGEWGAVAASSGGGDVVVIPTTGVYSNETTHISSVTAISATAVPTALTAGKIPMLLITFSVDDGNGTILGTIKHAFTFIAEAYDYNDEGTAVIVSSYSFSNGTIVLTVGLDGTITEER